MTQSINPTVTYEFSRLAFKKDLIEPLAMDEQFRVVTPSETFQMSKRDFYEEFPNVLKTKSYATNGLYHIKPTPKRAEKFRIGSDSEAKPKASSRKRFELPDAIEGHCSQEVYEKWLHRRAVAHTKRDKRRWKTSPTVSEYKTAIHLAVIEAGLLDAYTGEVMDWSLISSYDNEKSKEGGTAYKRELGSMPSVDHAGDEPRQAVFKICTWRTNDAKSDLSYEDFVKLCKRVVVHHDRNNQETNA